GQSPASFEEGCRSGTVTGHIGFPQSMRVVAARLGVTIDRIDRELEPIFAETELAASSLTVNPGETGGFRQRSAAIRGDEVWFEALFIGHAAPASIGQEPRDSIAVRGPYGNLNLAATPGMNPQVSSSSIVANSIRRVVEARPGWVTVGELPPAV